MNINEAKEFLKTQQFTFATSYAEKLPHYYLQRKQCTDQNLYEEFIHLIRKEGTVYHFYNKQYVYLKIEDDVYWEMGRPVKAVQVLNKASYLTLEKNNQSVVNAEISSTLKNKLQEREVYAEQLFNKEHKTEQDQRQIDFLMDSNRRIHGGGKNIIDNYKQEIRYE